MRIWDIPPERLCDRHLLGEHAELHAIWSILIKRKKGYSRHPETLRWRGRLKALYARHERLAKEMQTRGFSHKSLLDRRLARGLSRQDRYVDTITEQKRILRKKKCGCKV